MYETKQNQSQPGHLRRKHSISVLLNLIRNGRVACLAIQKADAVGKLLMSCGSIAYTVRQPFICTITDLGKYQIPRHFQEDP